MEDQPGIQPPRTEKELPSDVTSIHSIETQNDSLRATHPERPVPDVDTSWAAYRILLASVLISGLLFGESLVHLAGTVGR